MFLEFACQNVAPAADCFQFVVGQRAPRPATSPLNGFHESSIRSHSAVFSCRMAYALYSNRELDIRSIHTNKRHRYQNRVGVLLESGMNTPECRLIDQARQKSPGAPHIMAVLVAELLDHGRLFVLETGGDDGCQRNEKARADQPVLRQQEHRCRP